MLGIVFIIKTAFVKMYINHNNKADLIYLNIEIKLRKRFSVIKLLNWGVFSNSFFMEFKSLV